MAGKKNFKSLETTSVFPTLDECDGVTIDRRTWLKWTAGVGSVALSLTSNCLFAQNSTPALYHPLRGKGRVGLGFGATWVWGECPKGTYKKHCGVDLMVPAGTAVYAAYDGTVKDQGSDPNWLGFLIIEHRTPGGVIFTTTYWHIATDRSWASVKRGERIGQVADLEAKDKNRKNHLHFGLRQAKYSSVAKHGALPVKSGCGYPAFPEKFARPL